MAYLSLIKCSILISFCFQSSITQEQSYGHLEYIDSNSHMDMLIKNNELIIIVFVSDSCGSKCTDKIEYFNQLKSDYETAELRIGLYAVKNQKLHQKYGITRFPQVIFYRHGRYVTYKGNLSDSSSFLEWVDEHKERASFELNDSNFEHDTQASTGMTTGDWFVLFYKTDCGTSALIESEWEEAATKTKGQMNYAYVNFEMNPKLQERFYLVDSPALIFFRNGIMYRYTIDRIDAKSLISFSVGGWHKNVKSEKIPKEMTSFDLLLEYINRELKANNVKVWYSLYVVIGFSIITCLIFVFKIFNKKPTNHESMNLPASDNRFKFD